MNKQAGYHVNRKLSDCAGAPAEPSGVVSGEFVTETFEYDGGRQVTVYVPPDPPEAIVFAGDGHRCQYCGAQAENIDHIVPRSKGGQHAWDNVVAACRRCNARKRDHLLEETGMKLRHPPLAPRGRVWALAALGAVLPDWEPYLGLPAQVVPLTVLEEGAAALSA